MSARRVNRVAGCMIAAIVACLMSAEASSREASQPGYDTLKTLPNWQGWWGLEGPLNRDFATSPPPLKPELLAGILKVMRSDAGGRRDLYCRAPQFAGYSGGFVESVEFLFTPGRVTLTNESGLIRRIYTDGRALPESADATNAGLSVGHWEGQTLVVETIGIHPNALYPQPFAGAIPIGHDVKILERIALKDPDTLQFDITITAPEIFTAPEHRTRAYSRVPKRTALEVSFCTDFDRAVDPNTGKQRFDMTPPPDLPPPPPLPSK